MQHRTWPLLSEFAARRSPVLARTVLQSSLQKFPRCHEASSLIASPPHSTRVSSVVGGCVPGLARIETKDLCAKKINRAR